MQGAATSAVQPHPPARSSVHRGKQDQRAQYLLMGGVHSERHSEGTMTEAALFSWMGRLILGMVFFFPHLLHVHKESLAKICKTAFYLKK